MAADGPKTTAWAEADGNPTSQEQVDPDSFSFQEEEDFETIPWSVNYVLICILLPTLCGCLSTFGWAGFSLYVRSQGWDMQLAGVLVSVGYLARFFAQQAIFRFGLWTALPLSLLHLLLAIFGLVFLDQAWAVYGEVAAMLAFDVLVVVEGVTFEVWSDSEVMVAQAQSTVLSVYTLAYASAATLGGLLYDAASWEGIAIYHVAGLIVEVLVLAIQPAVHKSFREFVGCGAAIDKTDEVRPFSGATAIVPTASVASQNPTPESQRGQSLSLPGMVEGLAKRQAT
ncbi:unnamed protein product [Durusdinium trenchii]|uniref:Uncharacterized protein n=1 Tax=Durusdinium trenchii TaxID=1381693 RepID=A0ABP0N942_9DINO